MNSAKKDCKKWYVSSNDVIIHLEIANMDSIYFALLLFFVSNVKVGF